MDHFLWCVDWRILNTKIWISPEQKVSRPWKVVIFEEKNKTKQKSSSSFTVKPKSKDLGWLYNPMATTTPPTTPQLFSMKETTDNSVPLVKGLGMTPQLAYNKKFPGGRQDEGHGEVHHDWDEHYHISLMPIYNITTIVVGVMDKKKLMSGWLPVILYSTNRLQGQGHLDKDDQ